MAVITANYFSHALTRHTYYTAIVPVEPPEYPPMPGTKLPDPNAPLKRFICCTAFAATTATG